MVKKMTAKDKLYQALVDKLEWNHPYVWKGECQPQYPQSRNEWYAREFSRSNANWLGKNLDEALETIDEWYYEKIQQADDLMR